MVFSASIPKAICWLLAAALVAQPVTWENCTCDSAHPQLAGQGCCGSNVCHAVERRPSRGCCSASRDVEQSGAVACACRCCRRSVPGAPVPLPSERGGSTDWTPPAFSETLDPAVNSAVPWHDRGVDDSAVFGSASQRCVALCRLLL